MANGSNPTNPINLSSLVSHIEQPIVTVLADGTFAAVFDALNDEGRGGKYDLVEQLLLPLLLPQL